MFGGRKRRTHRYRRWRDWEREAEDAYDLIAESPEELESRRWVDEVNREADRDAAGRDREQNSKG